MDPGHSWHWSREPNLPDKEYLEQFSKYGKPQEFTNNWWTAESTKSERKCAKASKKAHTPEGRLRLQELQRENEKLLKKTESDFWRETIRAMTEPKELARLTKHSSSNSKLGLLKKPGGGISDESEVAGILLNEHAPGSYEAPKERIKPKIAIRYTDIRKLKFMTINFLRETLKEFGKKKRGGGAWRPHLWNAIKPAG